MESLMWVMAMVPVMCLGSLHGIGWLTGGMAMLVALTCPQAMATIGVLVVASFVMSLIAVMIKFQ